jgi:hypothetical protein
MWKCPCPRPAHGSAVKRRGDTVKEERARVRQMNVLLVSEPLVMKKRRAEPQLSCKRTRILAIDSVHAVHRASELAFDGSRTSPQAAREKDFAYRTRNIRYHPR